MSTKKKAAAPTVKPKLVPGARVRFVMGGLAVDDTDYIVQEGDLGEYVGPDENDDEAHKGWHIIVVIIDDQQHTCPVLLSMIETVRRGAG